MSPELKDEVTEVEEIMEDSDIEEVDEDAANKTEITSEKETSKRKRLAKENVYFFSDVKEAVTARDLLKYEDGSLVEGFRVFGFAKADKKLKRNDDRCLEGATNFVVARSADLAASWLLESQGWKGGLFQTKKKFGAGRGKSIILSTMLEYGKMLACLAFKEISVKENQFKTLITTAHSGLSVQDEGQATMFKQFYGPGGNYDHYREEDGTWKEANKEG